MEYCRELELCCRELVDDGFAGFDEYGDGSCATQRVPSLHLTTLERLNEGIRYHHRPPFCGNVNELFGSGEFENFTKCPARTNRRQIQNTFTRWPPC